MKLLYTLATIFFLATIIIDSNAIPRNDPNSQDGVVSNLMKIFTRMLSPIQKEINEPKISTRALTRFYFWDYEDMVNKKLINNGQRFYKPGQRTTLLLDSVDLKDSLHYNVVGKWRENRVSVSCVEFNIPCSEGKFVLTSNGHSQVFCGDIGPYNSASVTKYMQISFIGKGGPYTGNLKCIVSVVQGHLVTWNPSIFKSLYDEFDCPERLASPDTYATLQDCDCGDDHSDELLSTRALDGFEAVEHAHPFTAIIHAKSGSSQSQLCGGTLLSSQWVITTASTVQYIPLEYLSINLGNHDTTDPATGTSYDVIQSVYFDYSPFNKKNDVALLRIDTPLNFTSDLAVQPICFPNSCLDPVDYPVYIVGYGATTTDESTRPDILHMFGTSILPHSDCLVHYPTIDDTMVCAGASGANGCVSDKGASLWRYNSRGNAELVAILVYAESCDKPFNRPALFQTVLPYTEDIFTTLATTSASVCRETIGDIEE